MLLFSYFRILVVLASVAVTVNEAQSLLEREADSLIFLQCVSDLIYGEPKPSSIRVHDDIEYDRVDSFCSSPTTEWESQSDVSTLQSCASRSFERGLVMFKFTQAGGCQVSLNNEDASSQPPCDNPETVYITDDVFCMDNGQIYNEGEITYEDCPRECTKDGLIGPRRDGMITIAHPDTPPGCCPTQSDPCYGVCNNLPANWCEAFDFCKAFGLETPSVEAADDAQEVFNLLQTVSSDDERYRNAWVNIYKDNNGVWRHRASQNPVDASLWGDGELSKPGHCALADRMNYLVVVECDSSYIVMCRGPEGNFPICDYRSWAFLHQ